MTDGGVIVILGQGGSGKTTLAFDLLDSWYKGHRAVVVAPSVTHPRMRGLPIVASPRGMPAAHRVLYVVRDTVPWDELERVPLLLLDDIAAFPERDHDALERFIRGCRWRGQWVLITTHRIQRDLPRVTGAVARRVYYVGPLADRKEALELYYRSTLGGRMDAEAFCALLLGLRKYDYRAKNAQNSVLLLASC